MKTAARELRAYQCFSFAGGLDVKTSPLTLANRKKQDRLTLARNMVYSVSGGVSKRFDQETYNTTTLGATVVITGGKLFRHSNGTDYNVCGTDDGRLVRLNTDGTTTNLATGLTTGRRWSFDVYNDLLVCCNGADAPRKYDGTTVALLGGSPPSTARVVAHHGNRVFMLDQTQLSRLTWSALNNEEDYTTPNNAGSTPVAENDGSNCIGLVPSINELIILKGTRPYRLQGTSPSTFTIADIVPTTGSVGAAGFQGNVFALNNVQYLATSGITNLMTTQQFGDLKESFISDKIARYFEPGTDYTVSLNQLHLAAGVYDAQNGRLMWGVDTDGNAQNDTLLVYDTYTKGWSIWPSQSCASLWIVRNAANGREEVFMGGYDGFVRVLNRDVSTNTIDGYAKHISHLNAAGIEKSPRYIYLYFSEEGNYSVAVDTKFDFGRSGGQTYTASLLAGSKTLGVDWTMGVDPLGKKDQIVKRIDVSGLGEFLEIGVRNTAAGQPFTWLGYEVLWRPRRLVRRG